MTKVRINPGVCGFVAEVTAESEDQQETTVQVKSGCAAISGMMAELGDTFDAFEVCLVRPATNVFCQYAVGHFPVHAACPVISGICKCIEAECGLALKRNAEIVFEE